MSKCRFLTPCGICEIKSFSGVPYVCDLERKSKNEEVHEMPVPKFVEDKTYTEDKEVKTDLCKTCKEGDICEFSTKIFSGCRTTRCSKHEEADNDTN